LQRIEAFWRHLKGKATEYYKEALVSLSCKEGLLQVEDPLHRFCMVKLFLPLIENAVSEAILTWNAHTVRAVNKRGREREAHIPEMFFQASDRESGLVLPPPYAEGAILDMDEEVDNVDVVGNDTWNHNNDMGNFEAGMQDLQDEVSTLMHMYKFLKIWHRH